MNRSIIDNVKIWHKKFNSKSFNPNLIFKNSNTRKEILFSLSFFLTIMSIEILFNQPFKKKIKILHNDFYKVLFNKRFEKLQRIEINSFAYSFFLILQKLFEEDERLKLYSEEIIENSVLHWSYIDKLNFKDYLLRIDKMNQLWESNRQIVLSRTYESRIDLIFLLYKSFELGISDKKIIKKNISVLIFSVSKAQKDFRYDVLKEIKKKNI